MLYPRTRRLRTPEVRFTVALCAATIFAALGFAQSRTPVILISIDTLRGDAIGPNTPEILSWTGTRFTQAQSQIPLTLPSHTSLFTSTWPDRNGVEENAGKVPQNLPTLASVLKDHGYTTAAFIGSIFLERQLGLDRGFDTYDSPFAFEAFSRLSGEMLSAGNTATAYSVRERRPGALVLRAATQWLAAHKSEQVFVFIHLFDMHKPWRQPTYTAQLQAVDRLLGDFQRRLKQDGWWDRSLVVLLSDHGEGLGDHGESDHGYFIYQSTAHVPLIVHWPEQSAKLPARVDQPVGLIDVSPTILDFLKIPAPAGFEGRSVLNGQPRPVFTESVYARDSFGWSPLRAIRDGAWKYIEAPRPELYNLDRDPKESANLAQTDRAEATRLKTELAMHTSTAQSAAPAPSTSPDRNKQVLESLGYLAPGPRSSAHTSGADPKDKLSELLNYEDAVTLLGKGQTAAAIRGFRSIVAADPNNLLARRDLGVALIEHKQFAQALPELRKVQSASPGDYITLYELGIADEALGNTRQALADYQAAASLAPGSDRAQAAVQRIRRNTVLK